MELNGMTLQRRDGNGNQHYKLTEIEPGKVMGSSEGICKADGMGAS